MSLRTSFDADAGVLYVRREGARIARSRAAMHDNFMILNFDPADEVVGVQVMDAVELADSWLAHPDRNALPQDIQLVIARWLETAKR